MRSRSQLSFSMGQAPQVLPLQESLLAIEQIEHNFKFELRDSSRATTPDVRLHLSENDSGQ